MDSVTDDANNRANNVPKRDDIATTFLEDAREARRRIEADDGAPFAGTYLDEKGDLRLDKTGEKWVPPCAYCRLHNCSGGCIPEYKHRIADLERRFAEKDREYQSLRRRFIAIKDVVLG
ncbi:MAG: hypothetical protein GTO22_14360 [Gemmatimonadales bacterium]|nr:hypothetical protein [Gemmatimonadales bacterium]